MSEQFQRTLKGNPIYDPNASIGPIDSFLDMQKATHDYEKALQTATHPYQSDWTTWPVEKRSIYYYLGPDEGGGKHRYLYLIGNPVVWWGTLLGVVLTLLGGIVAPDRIYPHRRRLVLLGVAYFGSYLPFALIDRPMFLYHYFFPLLFSLAFAVYGIGVLAGWVPEPIRRPRRASPLMLGKADRRPSAEPWESFRGLVARPVTPLPEEPEGTAWRFATRRSAALYWGILVVALLVFLWFSPLTYGFTLTDGGLQDRMWLDTWR
jgi:dolichyl-phosphate-mannose--protein O-mannosyl transferase